MSYISSILLFMMQQTKFIIQELFFIIFHIDFIFAEDRIRELFYIQPRVLCSMEKSILRECAHQSCCAYCVFASFAALLNHFNSNEFLQGQFSQEFFFSHFYLMIFFFLPTAVPRWLYNKVFADFYLNLLLEIT